MGHANAPDLGLYDVIILCVCVCVYEELLICTSVLFICMQ